MMSDTEVLVVGAGPTGLVAAVELARRDVRVRVVDHVPPRPYAESRAEGVHARTLEILERLGLLPQVLDQGRVLAGFGFRTARRPIGVLSAAGLDSPHAHSVLLPQSAFETILLEHLATLGVTVERPVEVLGVEQSGEEVVARLPGGETLSARFLVAADGAHSVVRKQLGVSFDGAGIQGAYVMDAVASFASFARPPAADRGTFVLARGGFLVVGLRPDGTYRITLSLPARDERIARERPGRAELQVLLDEFRLGVRLESVSWSSAFFLSTRHVERLRHGRILLAGDAAHIHSPVGGQGMNTGVQDAVNLGWKLALAVRGHGGDALLDSYDAERLPVIRRLIASTTASTKPLLWRHPAATAVRDGALRVLLRLPRLQTALFDGFTGFTVRYPDSPLTLRERRPALPAGPRSGEIAPEAGGDRWYRHWAGDPRHQLLVFTGPATDHEAALAWAGAQAALVRPLLVAPQRSVDRTGTVDVVTDPTGALHRRFGAASGGTYLVRPDGIVAARAAGQDLAPLRRYLDLLAGQPVGSAV